MPSNTKDIRSEKRVLQNSFWGDVRTGLLSASMNWNVLICDTVVQFERFAFFVLTIIVLPTTLQRVGYRFTLHPMLTHTPTTSYSSHHITTHHTTSITHHTYHLTSHHIATHHIHHITSHITHDTSHISHHTHITHIT